MENSMTDQYMSQQKGQLAGGAAPAGAFRWKPVLAIGGGVAIILALMPALLPGVVSAISDTSVHAYWYISRASAFVAFILLWVSMLAGLGITSYLSRIWPGMTPSFELHRYTALLGIGFGLVHALVLLGDQYINYTLPELVVPFLGSNYRPEWVGFGQLSFYMLLVVAFSFYVRDRLGVLAWRLIHMLSFALFLMVLVHGVQSGTDSGSLFGAAIYWVCGLSVLLGSIYRVVAHRKDTARATVPAGGPVIAAGRAQARPSQPPARSTYKRDDPS
jgi:predicted ferric reductase